MYATVAQLAARVRIGTPTATQQEQLDRAIRTAMTQIDGLCGRSFEATSTTITVSPMSSTLLDVGYASSITSVDVDLDGDFTYETNIPSSQYTVSVDSKSRRFIQLKSNAVQTFPLGQGTVQVTGVFGEGTVPVEIIEATLLQSARLWKRQDAIFAEIRSENGLMRINNDFDIDARRILSDAGWLRTRNIVIV